MRSFTVGIRVFGWVVAIAATAQAQNQQPVQQPVYQQPVYQQPLQTTTSSTSRKREPWEMGTLYATSAGYGVGLGIWASAEIGIKDPGLVLIPPIVLGVAAPIGAYALDHPNMKRGQPMAITAGLMLGAGEGLGIWGTQRVSSRESNEWGFRGLSRAAAIGSTVGGVGGYLAGEFMEPPPLTSAMAVSGAFWGTAIGSMFGYASTNGDWGEANDRTALVGLVGYNAGMLVTGGLGAFIVPSESQLAWMWAGAGIGAAASSPVFLLYAGEGGPPARRGFYFMGTATTLGIVAGAIFGGDSSKSASKSRDYGVAQQRSRAFAKIEAVVPTLAPGQLGLGVFGTLE